MGEYVKGAGSSGEKASKRREFTLKNAAVLVVDDNDMNLKVAKGLMKRMGMVPDLASSGESCIDMIKEKRYDIILMDHMMPVMDGIETLAKINKEGLLSADTVVIALTANAVVGAREMYLEKGFKDYLSKPIVPEELENMLAEYLPSGTYSFENADTSKVSDAGVNKDTNTADDTEITQDVGTGNMDEMLDKLTEKGFNVKAALTYSMNDADFYKDLLETYVKSSAEKKSALKSFTKIRNGMITEFRFMRLRECIQDHRC